MEKIAQIVILGDLLYDCFVWADHLPRMGETVTGFANGFYSGGKGANQAVQAARLGAQVHMIGKVGADDRGRFLKESLKHNGVDADAVLVDAEQETGTDCVMIDRNGSNAIVVVPLANEHILSEEIEQLSDLIKSADVFLSQLQVNQEAITKALTICKEAGVCIVLNPAPARELPPELFSMADFVTPNETEAEFFTGLYQKDMEKENWRAAVAEKFHAMGVRRLIVTLGAEGALYSGDGEYFVMPAYPVLAVDTTAAGDAFNAAFALQWVRTRDVKSALAYGNAAGALTASRMGSQPSMPSEKEISAFIHKYEVGLETV